MNIFKNTFGNKSNIKYQPWLIIGDLNESSNPIRKNSVSNGNSTTYNKFNSFIYSSNLTYLGNICNHLHGVINVQPNMAFMLG